MASMLSGESSKVSQEKPKEGVERWYFSRKELEENSPSRQDGIDLKKETYLRKSYCTFLQDLGMRLKVPQVTIATAIIFCHRFFLRQSHAKHDRRITATVCMFLAGKVEETPRPLKDVILVSYEIIHKKDTVAVQRIKQKDVYEQQKELILSGERVVLGTLGFDLNLQHPYKPLVEAIKKFKVAQNALAQVAWNFVNDGLRTSLCLQFKPHHIAAGAIFLAAKFLKVKLPSDGEKVWWQEFDVTPRQLEEVSNQMLELYEQNKMPQSQARATELSGGGGYRHLSKGPTSDEQVTGYSSSHGGATSKASSSEPMPSRSGSDQQYTDSHIGPPQAAQTQHNDFGSHAENDANSKHQGNDGIDAAQNNEREAEPHQVNLGAVGKKSKFGIEGHGEDNEGRKFVQIQPKDTESKEKYHGRSMSYKDVTVGQLPQNALKKLDTEKLKAAFERRKARGDIRHKMDSMDELERELEDVEVPGETEKTKREKKQSWPKSLDKPEHENSHHVKHPNDGRDGQNKVLKGQSSRVNDFNPVEEGEVKPSDEADRGHRSPRSGPRKRKPDSPIDRNGLRRLGYSERDHKKHLQENHV